MVWREVFVTAVLWVVGLSWQCGATVGRSIVPQANITTVMADKGTGQVALRITAEVWPDIEFIEVHVMGDSRLFPTNRRTMSTPAGGRDSVWFYVPLTAPMNETTYVWFTLVEKSNKSGWHTTTAYVRDRQGRRQTVELGPHQGYEFSVIGERYLIRTSDTLIVTDVRPGYTETPSPHLETPYAQSNPRGGANQARTADASIPVSKGRLPAPLTTIDIASADGQAGRVTLRVTTEVRQYISEVGLTAEANKAALPGGVLTLSQDAAGKKQVAFRIPLNIPEGDTVAVLFTVIEKKVALKGQVFRETTRTDDSGKTYTIRELVEPFDEHHRIGLRYVLRVNDEIEMRDPYQMGQAKPNQHMETPNARSNTNEPAQQVPPQRPQQNGTSRTGFYLDDGTFVSSDSLTSEERRRFASTHSLFQRSPDDKPVRKAGQYITSLEAAAAALGFDYIPLMKSGALKVIGVEEIEDTTTPFVHRQLHRRCVWRIDISGVALDYSRVTADDSSLLSREFIIYVDSASSVVLRAVIRGPHFDESVIRRTSASFAEEQLIQISERYLGIPTVAPVISLKEALSRSSIPPELAMEVIADYLVVEYSVGHHKGPRSAWVVNLNGGFGFPVDCFPEIACNHYRMVVDAQSGEVLCSTNWPNPPLNE